ncbi:MAG: citrate (Si)-synthase [Armatimonadetes bacterium]|nr:citrate (Si)-synthase [Armatimonadota bacterium]
MTTLQERLAEQIPPLAEQVKTLVRNNAQKVVSEVTVEQLYGGMRGIKCLVCDTSLVEADTGLVIRGRPILELTECLPEEVFYLLLTAELPDKAALDALRSDFRKRATVPAHVWDVLGAMPRDSHPMTMLSTAVLVMEGESEFIKAYHRGIKKDLYWQPMLEDAMTIVARLPEIAAGIYRLRYDKGPRIAPDPNLDMGANYVHMLGAPDPDGDFSKLMRLYFVLHSDHESGNVSAMTTATVSSALSNLFYALSAGLNGLAGPLHGLANQECLSWILETLATFGGVPTHEQLEKYAWDTLSSGRVVPGYGHAVLRITDPRFDAFLAFGKKHCSDDPVFQTVARVFETVPNVLRQVKKIKDPWPNVDAISGSVLYHYGIHEFDYYTVLFGVSRAMGVCAQGVIARAMGYPIIRPKSVTTDWVQKTVEKFAMR